MTSGAFWDYFSLCPELLVRRRSPSRPIILPIFCMEQRMAIPQPGQWNESVPA